MQTIDAYQNMTALQEFDAVIESAGRTSVEPGTGAPYAYRLLVENGRFEAVSWISPSSIRCPAKQMPKARLSVIATPGALFPNRVIVAARPDPNIPILEHLPEDVCPVDGVILRVGMIANEIVSPPMRQSINEVLSLREVCSEFWRCTAGANGHHDFPGGLAAHSVEVAEFLADSPRLGQTERDIGIAYALLHDIGHVWTRTGTTRTSERAQLLGPNLVAFDHLRDAMTLLEREWPDGGTALTSLLCGLWRDRGDRPLMAVGEVVVAYDRVSQERDRRSRRPSDRQPWYPSDCSSTPAAFVT